MSSDSGVAPRDIGLLIVLGTLWGVSFMAIKAGLEHFDPFFFAAVRYDIAALIMIAMAFVWNPGGDDAQKGWRRLVPANRAQWEAVVVSAALNVMGYHAFLFWGEQYTTSAIAAVVIGLNPIGSMVMARAFLPGERVDAFGMGGLLLGIVGIVILVGLKPGDLLDARGIGEIMILGSVLSWSIGSVWVKRLRHRMPVVPFTATQMALGALMLHGLSLATEGANPRWDHTPTAIWSMVYLSVLASALGFFMYFTLLERIGPIRSALVSYIAPIAAAVSGWLVLAEALEARAVLAFLLIASGFGLVIRKRGGGARSTPQGDAAGAATGPAGRPSRVVRDP